MLASEVGTGPAQETRALVNAIELEDVTLGTAHLS